MRKNVLSFRPALQDLYLKLISEHLYAHCTFSPTQEAPFVGQKEWVRSLLCVIIIFSPDTILL